MAFFKWRKSEPAPARETEAPTDDDAVEQPEDEQPEGALDDDEDAHDDESDDHEDDGGVDEDVERSWRARAAAVIVGGASTGSKRPEALYGAGADFGPTH